MLGSMKLVLCRIWSNKFWLTDWWLVRQSHELCRDKHFLGCVLWVRSTVRLSWFLGMKLIWQHRVRPDQPSNWSLTILLQTLRWILKGVLMLGLKLTELRFLFTSEMFFNWFFSPYRTDMKARPLLLCPRFCIGLCNAVCRQFCK